MKTLTTAQFLKKKFTPIDWQQSILDSVHREMAEYDISDEVWERHVSVWISEALSEFCSQLRTKIAKDLKKHNKKRSVK